MMSNWGGLDFFIFLIFLVNVLLGMSRGATKEIISTFSLFAALVFTIKFTIPLTTFVNSSPLLTDVITAQPIQNFMKAMGMPPLTEKMLLNLGYSVSLLICFVGVYSICEAVLSYTSIVEAYPFRYAFLNRKLGASLGAMRGFVFTLILIVILVHLFEGNVPSSALITPLRDPARKLDHLITAQAPERYKEILENGNLYNAERVLNVLTNPR